METKKPVGIWIRVSTDFQVRDESPEHHERRAKAYVEAKGWEVIETYRLEAVSGKSVIEHPEAKRMLADLKAKRINGLIFSKLARLARNTKELLELAEIFRSYSADLISLSESIDTSTPAGRLFYTMIAAMAEWERAEIAERVAASVPIRAKMGKPLGGQASFGYRWDGKTLVIDEKEAPVRKLLYEIFLKCQRRKGTATELNKRGYRTRNGSKFSDTTISRLLRDPSAKGERRANYTRSLGEGRNWVIKPQTDWVSVPCPAIVSEELWNDCNRLLDELEGKRKKRGPKAAHLLSGLVMCSCGKKMYVYHTSHVYTCRTCKRRIAVDDIDEIYQVYLKEFLNSMDSSEFIEQSSTIIREKETLLKGVATEHGKLGKKMHELVNLRINGDLAKESFPMLYKPIEEQYHQLEQQIPELEAEIDFLKIQQLSSDTVLNEAQELYDQWPELAFENKRAIVETITSQILIDQDEITITLAYMPTSFQNSGKRQHNLKDS